MSHLADEGVAACAAGPAMELLDLERERHLLASLRWRVLRAMIGKLWRDSLLRVLLVAGLTLGFWLLMFWLFWEGFGLLRTAIPHQGTLALTIHAIYNVFFLSLLGMISLSSSILYYAAVYRAADVQWLLTIPLRPGRIALDKLLETSVFACWGFLLLSTPLLVAYGCVMGSPWSFFGLLGPFLIAFALIAAEAGALGCIVFVALPDSARRWVLTSLVIVVAIAAFGLMYSVFASASYEMLSVFWLQGMLSRLKMAEQRWLPSWWLSTGLLEAAQGGRAGTLQSCGFLSVLVANAAALWLVVGEVAQRVLRGSFARLSSSGRWTWKWKLDQIDQAFERLLGRMSPGMRLLLLKDLKVFRRDPLQWSQFLLFFGLLVFYFCYVRRFEYGQRLVGWMTAIGFMNLGVVGLILSTFTTRFVFPLISLEGQRFWILGTSPIPRVEILWAKFLFATLITCTPCCLLVMLSDFALQLWGRTPALAALHQWLCLELSVSLSALAVGMGAYLPNLREASPAKIAAGFGGTLTLILSALLVILVITPVAIPAYLLFASEDTEVLLPMLTSTGEPLQAKWYLALGIFVSSCVTVVAVVIPLFLGIRRFTKYEMNL